MRTESLKQGVPAHSPIHTCRRTVARSPSRQPRQRRRSSRPSTITLKPYPPPWGCQVNAPELRIREIAIYPVPGIHMASPAWFQGSHPGWSENLVCAFICYPTCLEKVQISQVCKAVFVCFLLAWWMNEGWTVTGWVAYDDTYRGLAPPWMAGCKPCLVLASY